MQVTFRIQRYDPKNMPVATMREYVVENIMDTDTVLDVLHRIKWEQDGSLAFRRSCGHGICGSCAMRVNNQNMLVCSVLLKDLKHKKPIKIEPLPSMPVIKDLIVDMTTFYEKLYTVKPYLVNDESPPPNERHQEPEDAERLFEAAKCILCACCTTSCPSTWTNDNFLGPAAMLKAGRFVFDTRDRAGDERLGIIDSPLGIWRCHTIFNCVEACPKEIDITGHLSQLKRAVVARNI
jgi:succinate dehydrogenase / fumarate reductase, iron-sulfur subunit